MSANVILDPAILTNPVGLGLGNGVHSGSPAAMSLSTFILNTVATNTLGSGGATSTLTYSGSYGSHGESPLTAHWNVANTDWDIPALTVNRTVTFTRVWTPRSGPLNVVPGYYTVGVKVREVWKYTHTTIDATVTNPGCDPLDDVVANVIYPLNASVDFDDPSNFMLELRPSSQAYWTHTGDSSLLEIDALGLVDINLLGKGSRFELDPILQPASGEAAPKTVPLQYTISKEIHLETGLDAITLDVGGILGLLGDLVNSIPLDALSLDLGTGELLAPWATATGTATGTGTPSNVSDLERLDYFDLFG
ncbi:hypothetical protein [Nocardioides yefusunii]|uniref:Uncharacterized protein n=1 Tax=Nocardioides yefusunii TaxID=2500546 RepID=A0ABW1QV45_9ACTN|nr:hypothetical protein [Nocardioides yefusunii]